MGALENAFVGRSHRAAEGVKRVQEVIEKSKAILGMPKDWRLALVPGSDTGAIEMAMWSLLGPRGVDVLAWEIFGKLWAYDITQQLKLSDVRVFNVPFGALPDLSAVDTDRDVVFTWNGTTSGVCVPHGDWIKKARKGLTICDATSAVFAMDLPWDRLDVVTWSWQKALGGEAAHGMLALSPRAVARLVDHTPPWPIPKLFRLTKDGKFFDEPFEGKTMNTPSMLAVEDCADALRWVESLGGLPAMIARSQASLKAAAAWVERTPWADFLAERPDIRSSTSICLKVVDPWLTQQSPEQQIAFVKSVEALLAEEGVAYEVANHREAPASFRLWAGATVETADIAAALEWIDWGYQTLKARC